MKSISDAVYEVWRLGRHVPELDTRDFNAAVDSALHLAKSKRTKTQVRQQPGIVLEYTMHATEFDHRRTPAELREYVYAMRRDGKTPEQISAQLEADGYKGLELCLAVLTQPRTA